MKNSIERGCLQQLWVVEDLGPELELKAKVIAKDLGVKLKQVTNVDKNLCSVSASGQSRPTHVLIFDEQGLCLRAMQGVLVKAAPLRLSFTDEALHYRLKTSGRRQGLGQALGLQHFKDSPPRVIDATAGLGRDAALMAYLGAQVTMIERDPVLFQMLSDALIKGAEELKSLDSHWASSMLANLTLMASESRKVLAQQDREEGVDIVYLDPMYPEKEKNARSRKELALLHELLGSEEDLPSLLELARNAARKRVILKRPNKYHDTRLPKPSFIVPGKIARFDVYING
jgi:16S rRNA (guanine1516-N2)-methyltransferase